MTRKPLFLLFFITISLHCAHSSTWFQKASRGGHKTQILKTGKDLNAARNKLIATAKRTIYLTSFIFTSHPDQTSTYKLLCKKALEKVDVRILIDNLGSGQGGPELPDSAPSGEMSIQLLKRCGIKFEKYKPIGLLGMLFVKHDKILVVDSEKFIIGGSNFSTDYSNHGRDEILWYDLDIMVAGPMACYYHNVFIYSWKNMYKISARNLRNRQRTRPGRRFPKRSQKYLFDKLKNRYDLSGLSTCEAGKSFGKSRFLSIYNNPYFTDKRPILDLYSKMFSDLRKSNNISDKKILLYAPYLIPHKKWAKQIINLSRDGFDIHIITNSLESIDKSAWIAYTGMLMTVGALIRNNVKIHLWNPKQSERNKSWNHQSSNVFHKKGGVYGSSYALFGSDNLDTRGQEYSSETVSLTNDKKIIKDFTQNYFEDLKYTTRLNEKKLYRLLEQESLLDKFLAWVALPFL